MTQERLSEQELSAESATPLPNKEVMSLLDLNADVNLGLDLAAPVDLAVAANLNIAAPIDAAASANLLSVGSDAGALAHQQTLIDQHLSGDAIADAPQDATVDQSAAPAADTAPAGSSSLVGDPMSGDLLNVDVNIDADANIAAPIAGAVAANGNIAAPIDAAVAANIGSIDSSANAIADQTAIVTQDIDGATADATADQVSTVNQ
ncbi:MAG TPA: peptidoglycan-binding protein [Mycobacteriales bacterium]|nr:peptidoglycan-binding protein [Mycobacteriales bacterium]